MASSVSAVGQHWLDTDDEAWWLELQFAHQEPIESLSVRNELLFELFPDQTRFLKVIFFPSGNSQTLYFVHGSAYYKMGAKDGAVLQ